MQAFLTVAHLFLAIGLIALVLIQHGKGADAGAAFGSGASGTVFGAQGASNFLSRTTAVLATLFFVTSIALGYFSMQRGGEKVDLMQEVDGKVVAPAVAPPVKEKLQSDLPDIPQNKAAIDGNSDLPVVPSPTEQAEAAAPVAGVEAEKPAASEEKSGK